MSEQQLENLHTYSRSLMEKKQAELQDRYRRAVEAEDNGMSCPKRDVTPVWRLSFSDCVNQHGSGVSFFFPSFFFVCRIAVIYVFPNICFCFALFFHFSLPVEFLATLL